MWFSISSSRTNFLLHFNDHETNTPSFQSTASPQAEWLLRSFCLWSMKKDPELESALSRNRRWIVNNQIKNIILRYPNNEIPIETLQKKFKTLDLQGKALNWVSKYPAASRLTSSNHELKRNFGFPDDYLIRIVPKYPDLFRIVNESGRRSSMVVELVNWNPEFAVSAVEALARKHGTKPCFSCLVEGSKEMEKRNVGLVHELLSLTLWKKASIVKLGHFRREFLLPDRLNVLLLKHPGIFYVSNKYKIYTVLLREAYVGSQLVDKDPLVVVKEKFGELMQEGLHEYNQNRRLINLEKRRKKGVPLARVNEIKGGRRRSHENSDSDEDGNNSKMGGLLDPEERKRFYKVLFDDGS
ncbi:Plant organelle RNA recognition domain [Sesbania bispinosa]|nr:Plant organelle RNA recognition domain [Sesbania bispinosa]